MSVKICISCKASYDDTHIFCPLCNLPLRTKDKPLRGGDLFIGRVIDKRYRINGLLGTGGMANVYEGVDCTNNRLVAIKMIRPELAKNSVIVRRFKREAHLALRLRHPGIISTLATGETAKGQLYIVMELLHGQLLEELIGQGKLDIGRSLRFSLQISQAMERAHGLNIMHRDLKPENVLIVEEQGCEVAKIFDFGISKRVDSQTGITSVGNIIGTPAYMSPEQIRNQGVGLESDIYSLGAIMYNMITGRNVFQANSLQEMLELQLLSEPASFSEFNDLNRIPPRLELLVFNMLEKDPKKRIASMEKVRWELGAITRNLGLRKTLLRTFFCLIGGVVIGFIAMLIGYFSN